MVEIIYEPWKTIIIHAIVQYEFKMLIHLQSLGIQSGQLGRPINWSNGVAFVHRVMPPTDEVIKEQIQGKIHWSHLSFAFMPKHQPLITIPEGKIRIPILDLSDNEVFRELTGWIKKHYRSK